MRPKQFLKLFKYICHQYIITGLAWQIKRAKLILYGEERKGVSFADIEHKVTGDPGAILKKMEPSDKFGYLNTFTMDSGSLSVLVIIIVLACLAFIQYARHKFSALKAQA